MHDQVYTDLGIDKDYRWENFLKKHKEITLKNRDKWIKFKENKSIKDERGN